MSELGFEELKKALDELLKIRRGYSEDLELDDAPELVNDLVKGIKDFHEKFAAFQQSHMCIEKKQLHLFLKWTMFIKDDITRKMFQKAFKELLGIKEEGDI